MRDLERIVGAEHVLAGRELEDASSSRGISGIARAIVRPGSAEEVRAVLAWCYSHDVALVPRGGGSGFSGGAVPVSQEEVVLELSRLDRVLQFDPGLWRIHVQAGLRTSHIQRIARESGLLYPPDPGAAEQSQIGGNIATNAGGPHAFKYGVTGAWVTGLEAALPPGDLVRLGGPHRKDSAGYDLRGLLIGSEGTLGIVTAAWLRLIPAPSRRDVVCAFYADSARGCAAVLSVLEAGVQAAALEFLDAGALAAAPRAGFPRAGFAVIAEADAPGVLADLLDALGPGSLGVREEDPAELWRWRDRVSIAVTAQRGGKLSEDICVPVEQLEHAIEGTLEIAGRHGLQACSWGHAGDGNLHSTFLLGPGESANAAAHELFELAVQLGGTVSGEHGMGQVKLPLHLSEPERAANRALKRALDPKGLLNPGKKRFSEGSGTRHSA
ncbi:MAG: FAD-binding oxidoreductase [Solirubrobacteraceae bacterium]